MPGKPVIAPAADERTRGGIVRRRDIEDETGVVVERTSEIGAELQEPKIDSTRCEEPGAFLEQIKGRSYSEARIIRKRKQGGGG